MRHPTRLLVLLLALFLAPEAARGDAPRRLTASAYPMDYLVSLPSDWTPDRTWPVLVAIPDASRAFAQTMDAFLAARRNKPWIVVVPVVMGGGGMAQRFKEAFGYPETVWARLDKDGACRFDADGLAAVLAEIRSKFKGEGRAFLTGWEAAGHVIWRELIHNPRAWYAAALVLPNFQGRCIEETQVSKLAQPISVAVLRGSDDKLAWNGAPLDQQAKAAADYARGIGFRVEEITVPGKVRGPFPDEVFSFFENVRAGR
jgi:hypothetical protein